MTDTNETTTETLAELHEILRAQVEHTNGEYLSCGRVLGTTAARALTVARQIAAAEEAELQAREDAD